MIHISRYHGKEVFAVFHVLIHMWQTLYPLVQEIRGILVPVHFPDCLVDIPHPPRIPRGLEGSIKVYWYALPVFVVCREVEFGEFDDTARTEYAANFLNEEFVVFYLEARRVESGLARRTRKALTPDAMRRQWTKSNFPWKWLKLSLMSSTSQRKFGGRSSVLLSMAVCVNNEQRQNLGGGLTFPLGRGRQQLLRNEESHEQFLLSLWTIGRIGGQASVSWRRATTYHDPFPQPKSRIRFVTPGVLARAFITGGGYFPRNTDSVSH